MDEQCDNNRLFGIQADSVTTGDALDIRMATSSTSGDAIEINRGGTKVAGIDGYGQLSVGSFGGSVTGASGISFGAFTNVWTSSAGAAPFFTVDTGTSDVVVRGDGNVGIGDTTPDALVDIEGGDLRLGTGTFNNTSANEDVYVTGNLEVDGTIYGDGSGLTNLAATTVNSVRYDQLRDAGTFAGASFGTFSNTWTSSATTTDFLVYRQIV